MLDLDTLIVLGRLSPRAREVLVDRALMGLSAQEIATRDRVSFQKVHSALQRAREQLDGQPLNLEASPRDKRAPRPDRVTRRYLSAEEREGLRRLLDARARTETASSEFAFCAHEKCAREFFRRSKQQIYCSRQCANNAYRARRWRNDPDFRERKRARARANWPAQAARRRGHYEEAHDGS